MTRAGSGGGVPTAPARPPRPARTALGARRSPAPPRGGARSASRSAAVTPEEDGRAGARDRRADRAQLARAPEELHRARVEPLAARLVEPVVESARDQIEIAS